MKYKVMSSIGELVNSKGYKQFMKKLLCYSIIVFVLGILFLLMHWPGGNVMVITGGGCLIFVMVFFIIGKFVTRE